MAKECDHGKPHRKERRSEEKKNDKEREDEMRDNVTRRERLFPAALSKTTLNDTQLLK